MRAKEFLRENTDEYIANFLKYTTEYFAANPNLHTPLYRGERRIGQVDNFVLNHRSVVDGRRPTDTNDIVHTMMNDNFRSDHDFPFRFVTE